MSYAETRDAAEPEYIEWYGSPDSMTWYPEPVRPQRKRRAFSRRNPRRIDPRGTR